MIHFFKDKMIIYNFLKIINASRIVTLTHEMTIMNLRFNMIMKPIAILCCFTVEVLPAEYLVITLNLCFPCMCTEIVGNASIHLLPQPKYAKV